MHFLRKDTYLSLWAFLEKGCISLISSISWESFACLSLRVFLEKACISLSIILSWERVHFSRYEYFLGFSSLAMSISWRRMHFYRNKHFLRNYTFVRYKHFLTGYVFLATRFSWQSMHFSTFVLVDSFNRTSVYQSRTLWM